MYSRAANFMRPKLYFQEVTARQACTVQDLQDAKLTKPGSSKKSRLHSAVQQLYLSHSDVLHRYRPMSKPGQLHYCKALECPQ